MTKDEALKLLEDATRSCNNIDEQRALDALMREALAQPVQEPSTHIGWMVRNSQGKLDLLTDLQIDASIEKYERLHKLYTTPPLPVQPVRYNCTVVDDKHPDGIPFKDWVQPEKQNFCPRCGKRTADIHTCTPPQENT